MTILKVENLTVRFGGLTAVSGATLRVDAGCIYSVIGPNGAGKTTLFNAVTGVYVPTEGTVRLRDREVLAALTVRDAARIALIAAVSALGVLAALNLEPAWEQVIVARYVYQQAFDWGGTAAAVADWARSRTALQLTLPLALGALLGAAGSVATWMRARRAPDVAARHGIMRTFQNIRLFQEMTVLDNVLVGMHNHIHSGFLAAALRLPRFWRERAGAVRKAFNLLEFTGLRSAADRTASALPYGHQRRLEIARALAAEPAILLLDEPGAGMNPSEIAGIMDLIRRIRDRGITVILIEHHMKVVMGISDRIMVLDHGETIAEGTPSEISRNPRVIEAYLGKTHETETLSRHSERSEESAPRQPRPAPRSGADPSLRSG